MSTSYKYLVELVLPCTNFFHEHFVWCKLVFNRFLCMIYMFQFCTCDQISHDLPEVSSLQRWIKNMVNNYAINDGLVIYTSRTHSSKKANLPNLVVLSPSYRHPFQSLSLTLLSWKTIPPKLLKPTSDKPFENEHWDRNSQVVEMHMPWIAKKILNCEKFDTLQFRQNPCM